MLKVGLCKKLIGFLLKTADGFPDVYKRQVQNRIVVCIVQHGMEIRRAPLSKSPLRRQIIQNIQREFNLGVFYAVTPAEKFSANK